MAKVRITLDKRISSCDKDGKYPLVLRISHQRKTRDIGFDIHVSNHQFSEDTGKITGIQNAVRRTKRIEKIFSDIDLWIDEHKGDIKLWHITKLKDEIERRFFNKQLTVSILHHAGRLFYRMYQEERFSTITTYEASLKTFIKFRMKQAKKDDKIQISTLYELDTHKRYIERKGSFIPKEEFLAFDIAIKALNVELTKDYKAYLAGHYNSLNSVNLHLRNFQAIMSDASKIYVELKDHNPLSSIKKKSIANMPVFVDTHEINMLRNAKFEEDNPRHHVRNYFLFMFSNMGMNFYDMALLKVNNFDGERVFYTRKKTEKEGDHFSILQNKESLNIIHFYIKGKNQDDYLFPIIPKETLKPDIHKVKQYKVKWFNTHMKKITTQLGIKKKITTYTPRDTWTNLGLLMGIDIRKISTGLGHSSVVVTEKHYSQVLQQKILDEINTQITEASLI